MFGNCPTCVNKVSFDRIRKEREPTQLGKQIAWFQWVKTEDGKYEKVKKVGTVQDALSSLCEKLPAFKIHCFIKTKQASEFQLLHTTPRANHAVIQVDFSENATIVPQDEIQSAHWTHGQATLFPGVAWTQEGTYPFGVISDSLNHDKFAAATFLDSVLDELQKVMTAPLTEIDIFSDGAAQHFKQKYMFRYVSSLLDTRGVCVNWHFFATLMV